MVLKVLIVEDQFLEANNLKIILEKAGHQVWGIAKSVDQAMGFLRKGIPDVVLVDIFLKGDITGIHLAYTLTKRNIPFVYLSANSNESTLEEARLTQPYGFLVKPFREKELLLSLDIAMYRYRQNQELVRRQEQWLSGLLTSIINIGAGRDQKLQLLARAFTSFVPYDYLVIDTNPADTGTGALHFFQRTGMDDHISLVVDDCLHKSRITPEHLYTIRKTDAYNKEPYFQNGEAFFSESQQNVVSEKIRRIYGIQSKLWVPLGGGGIRETGVSILFYSLEPESYTDYHLGLMSSLRGLLAKVFVSILGNETGEGLPSAHVPAIPATRLLRSRMEGIVGNSPRLLDALDKVTQVAPFDSTVLILGETGVGKEGIVNALHALSQRKSKPLIKVNCAAIPLNLIESELFGHERGAFTDATDRRIGKFEQAQDGTLFLDEVGELPIEVQSKLLRAIQEKEIERLGGKSTIHTNVRIVAATNRNLLKEVAEERFRMDLYYRLNVFPITLAPLRERKEDIPALAGHFLQLHSSRSGSAAIGLSTAAMQQLMDHSWPGNIRELEHVIERHVVLAKNNLITAFELSDESVEVFLPAGATGGVGGIGGTGVFEAEGSVFGVTGKARGLGEKKEDGLKSIAEMEMEHIIAALKKCNGKISGKGGAAELLKLPPTTLNSKIKRLGINWSYS